MIAVIAQNGFVQSPPYYVQLKIASSTPVKLPNAAPVFKSDIQNVTLNIGAREKNYFSIPDLFDVNGDNVTVKFKNLPGYLSFKGNKINVDYELVKSE